MIQIRMSVQALKKTQQFLVKTSVPFCTDCNLSKEETVTAADRVSPIVFQGSGNERNVQLRLSSSF
jgi:hypothetical protein